MRGGGGCYMDARSCAMRPGGVVDGGGLNRVGIVCSRDWSALLRRRSKVDGGC